MYINTYQVGNILCLDTKCFLVKDITQTHILFKSEKNEEILHELMAEMCFYKSGH